MIQEIDLDESCFSYYFLYVHILRHFLRFYTHCFKWFFLVRLRKDLHLIPPTVPVSVSNTSNTCRVKILLTKLTRTSHRRSSVSEKSSHMNDFSSDVSNLVTQDHLSMTGVCTVSATTLIKPEKLRGWFLVVGCGNNLVASLDKSDNMIRITLSRGNLSNSVVLQSPCSWYHLLVSAANISIEASRVKTLC